MMQHLRQLSMYSAILVVSSCASMNAFALDEPLAPEDHSVERINQVIKSVTPPPSDILVNELPSLNSRERMSKKESVEYLENNPEIFEKLLGTLLIQGNASALKELLPIYEKIPNADPSVFDWGNAIIAAKEGRLDEAVTMYRQINAQLPDVKALRFQLAMALFYNRQFDAAQSEFEKMRSEAKTEEDVQVINKYLDAINRQDRWSFNGSVSYLDDDNINNSAKEGTILRSPNGSEVVFKTPRESGTGLSYYVSADKRKFYDNKTFTAVHLNSYGKYYWNNKSYNDLTAGIGVGFGYENAVTEVELEPFYNKRLYGQGRSGDGDLHSYADVVGLNVKLNQWLKPNLRYQGLLRYSKSDYIDKYDYNNGHDWLLANTAIYLPNATSFFTAGIDFSNKEAEEDAQSYKRPGVRIGWGQTWPRGYSTKLDLGYAKRDYEEEDFFGIKRENKEYSAGLQFWKRDFSIYGLTPRLELDYFKVNSNSPFEEYDKTNVSVELTKTF